MVQSIDSLLNKPVYNAVNINIRKPEVNTPTEDNTVVMDNGIYNAVKINIDKPAVNPIHKKAIYCYPEAHGCVTCDMAGLNSFELPKGFPIAAEYHSASVIVPETEEVKPEVPEPNYTTVEAENKKDTNDSVSVEDKEDKTPSGVTFHGTESTIKKPEIIPSEDIKPDVDISLVVSNLNSSNFDVQAQQMEEIVRKALDDEKQAIPYIVRDVYSQLIDITKKDTSTLATPSTAQIEARKKLIANFLTLEQNPNAKELPFKLTDNEIALANEISPMEQAERNKEYALYTMAVLSKIFIDEVQADTGNVVPFTDIPGVSDTVDALRYNPNPGVKSAAIDALSYIQRPEYKDELTTLYNLAQADNNPIVAKSAERAIAKLNQQ